MDLRLAVLSSVCLLRSIHSVPGRQSAPEPQSPGRVPHLPLLLRHQLDDPHLHTPVISQPERRDSDTDWGFFMNAAVNHWLYLFLIYIYIDIVKRQVMG